MTRGNANNSKQCAPNISVSMVDPAIEICFGEVLHLRFDRRDLRGVQSWQIKKTNRYFIGYTLKDGGFIKTDYDSEVKWRAILDGLRKVL